MKYNYNRSYEERHKRFAELSMKRCTQSEAKYVVIHNRDAYYGDFSMERDCDYFTNLSTAKAWAMHYSDTCDHTCGIFKMPKFIQGVDVR